MFIRYKNTENGEGIKAKIWSKQSRKEKLVKSWILRSKKWIKQWVDMILTDLIHSKIPSTSRIAVKAL